MNNDRNQPIRYERMRFIVSSWDEHLITGHDASDPSKSPITVRYGHPWHLAKQLFPQATLNLLDVSLDADGNLSPRLFILDPDYLVDITSVCQCIKAGVVSPLFHLLDMFLPKEDTLAIQLGNVANQFMDDAVRGESSFAESMQKSFRDYPLKYCTLEGVDKGFFEQCHLQHRNISHVVSDLFPTFGIDVSANAVMLEPSFVCDALGLQGRMDLLTTDLSKIVELKSGKQDEFLGSYKTEHAWQMALYKEILHYGLGRKRQDVRTLLLYSRYPRLYDISVGMESIAEALDTRNGIVHLHRMLRADSKAFLLRLREEDFNPTGKAGKLYRNYIRPRITSFLDVLHEATPVAFEYFCEMLSFVLREQQCAKTGDGQPDGDCGYARAWRWSVEAKRNEGYILTDLVLRPTTDDNGMLTHVEAQTAQDLAIQTNFREGDSVILYERQADTDLMTNHQTIRCHIEHMKDDRLKLRLDYPQRQGHLRPDARYAIEPTHSDSLFTTQLRGLYALLKCPEERRALLLGQRPPTRQDYYLLVGPPGSGKTSRALRKMVEDLHAHQAAPNILLMAYTNRAVDEICQMLETLRPQLPYIRIGQDLCCLPAYRPRLMRNVLSMSDSRQSTLQRIMPVRIFCGTVASLAGSSDLLRLKQFHTAILDEASQVLEPQLLPLLCATTPTGEPAIRHLVMIGDHKQLPAVVVQAESDSAVRDRRLREIGLENCRDSLFERLHRLALRNGQTGVTGLLSRQGRMHQEISQFISRQYYAGKLATVPLPHQTRPTLWDTYDASAPLQAYLATHRMGAIDVPHPLPDDNEKSNRQEATVVAQAVQELHTLHQRNGQPWVPTTQIGIIVPFRSQISTVRQALRQLSVPRWQEITIDTVERYQGSQRDVILFSTVVRTPAQLATLSAPATAEGLRIDRKLNVAVTRARLQFLLVGNLPLLRQSDDYRALIEYTQSPFTITS